ncbi:MAG: MATE family efflux transporter [Marinilabiliaceae bacterium]|nr:MATE family efflux transporter [Marinilabiliaceae bacterium]
MDISGLWKRCSNHYWSNLKLATPVVLAQAGQMLVGLADTLMVGRIGATPLAAVSFANSIFINILVFGIGISYALTPLVGKAFGKGDQESCKYWLRQGVITNLIIGVLLALFAGGIAFFMPFMGQDQAVVDAAIPYFLLLVLSIVPFQVFAGYKQFAEGLSNTKVAMLITLGGNLVNVGLNFVLIYGYLGMPEMGLVGAGWGTLLSRVFMAVAFVWVFNRFQYFKQYYHATGPYISRAAFVRLFKLGLPIGLQFVIEVFAFSLGSIMMGWINATSLAAHQIVLSLASMTYMMSSGLASATTIKVSIFRGRKESINIQDSAFASVHLVIVFMSVMGVLFVMLRQWIPHLFIADQEVISVAAGLMLVAGIFQIFDGVQVVSLGILRGLEDVVVPAIGAGVTYLLVAIPVSYLCAFKFEIGPMGIWIGYLVGLSVAGVFLLSRFRWLYKKRYAEK